MLAKSGVSARAWTILDAGAVRSNLYSVFCLSFRGCDVNCLLLSGSVHTACGAVRWGALRSGLNAASYCVNAALVANEIIPLRVDYCRSDCFCGS